MSQLQADDLDSRLLEVAEDKEEKTSKDSHVGGRRNNAHGGHVHRSNINVDDSGANINTCCPCQEQCSIFAIILLWILIVVVSQDVSRPLWYFLLFVCVSATVFVMLYLVVKYCKWHYCFSGLRLLLVTTFLMIEGFKLLQSIIDDKPFTTDIITINLIISCLCNLVLPLMYIYTHISLDSHRFNVYYAPVDQFEQCDNNKSSCNCFDNYCNCCQPRFHLDNYHWWYSCVTKHKKCTRVHSDTDKVHNHDGMDNNNNNNTSLTIMSQMDALLSIKLILFVCQEIIFCSKSIILIAVSNRNFSSIIDEIVFIETRIGGVLGVIFGLLLSRCQCCQKNCDCIVFGLCCKRVQHKHKSVMLRFYQLQLFWNFSWMINIVSIGVIQNQLQEINYGINEFNWENNDGINQFNWESKKSWEYLLDIVYCTIQLLFALRFVYRSYVLYLLLMYKRLTVDESQKISKLLQRSLKMYLCFNLRIDANNGSLVDKIVNLNNVSIFANDAVYQNSTVKRQKNLKVPCFVTFQIVLLSVYVVWHCIVACMLLFDAYSS